MENFQPECQPAETNSHGGSDGAPQVWHRVHFRDGPVQPRRHEGQGSTNLSDPMWHFCIGSINYELCFQANLGDQSAVNASNVLQYLAEIESKTNELVQQYMLLSIASSEVQSK